MAERLAPGVWLLKLGWPAPFGSNAYLVDDGDLSLIDTGYPINSVRIGAEIRDAGASVSEIDRVLITHYDLDHVGGLARLVPELDAPVYIGAEDLALIRSESHPPSLHHKGLFHRGLRAIYRLPSSLTYHGVEDGDRIGGFLALHTPGHNPGHTVYLHEERGAAFLGDLVWESDGALTTPIRLDSYDLSELNRSISRLVDVAPEFDLACMAHGDPIRSNGDGALKALADSLAEAD